MSGKPSLYVLAGVNGAGKSSVGGAFLRQLNLPWYNSDSVARALVGEIGMAQLDEAISEKNALLLKPRWAAIRSGTNFASPAKPTR